MKIPAKAASSIFKIRNSIHCSVAIMLLSFELKCKKGKRIVTRGSNTARYARHLIEMKFCLQNRMSCGHLMKIPAKVASSIFKIRNSIHYSAAIVLLSFELKCKKRQTNRH